MDVTSNSVILLCVAALILAVIAVLIDRLNFPQSRFRPKRIKPARRGPARDRTGAHILDVDQVEATADGSEAAEEVER